MFSQLQAELTRINGKSEWRRMGVLFALPPLGDQRPGELLVQMKRLQPEDKDLWFRWPDTTDPWRNWQPGQRSSSRKHRWWCLWRLPPRQR